jgi:hypothetical protein
MYCGLGVQVVEPPIIDFLIASIGINIFDKVTFSRYQKRCRNRPSLILGLTISASTYHWNPTKKTVNTDKFQTDRLRPTKIEHKKINHGE